MRDLQERRELLSNAKKLRQSADAYTKTSVFINPDLTLMERQEGYALGSELRRRENAGEADLMTKRRKIVNNTAPS